MEKLLIIAPDYLPVPAVKGGGVEQLITALVDQNEKSPQSSVTVVSKFDRWALKKSLAYTYTTFHYIHSAPERAVKILNIISRGIRRICHVRYLDNALYQLALRQKIRSMAFDSVIVENKAEFVHLVYAITGVKPLLHVHNEVVITNLKKIKDGIDDLGGLIFVSQYLADVFDRTFPSSNVRRVVVPNAIQQNLFYRSTPSENLRESLGFKSDDKVIIFVGRTIPGKGIQELIDAFALLDNPHYRLLIVGNPWYGKDKDVSTEIKSSNVTYTGYVDNNKLANYYNLADVAVFPSVASEAAGLVQIEAMCCGVPAIVSSSGGMPEYALSDKFVVSLGRNFVQRLASKIDSVLSLSDSDLENLKRKASIHARKYTMERYSDDIFNEIGRFIK